MTSEKKDTLKQKWNWFNMGWQMLDESESGIHRITCCNFPLRVIGFIWQQWVSIAICRVFGHKWKKVEGMWDKYGEDYSFSYCTRCGVDTEPPKIYV